MNYWWPESCFAYPLWSAPVGSIHWPLKYVLKCRKTSDRHLFEYDPPSWNRPWSKGRAGNGGREKNFIKEMCKDSIIIIHLEVQRWWQLSQLAVKNINKNYWLDRQTFVAFVFWWGHETDQEEVLYYQWMNCIWNGWRNLNFLAFITNFTFVLVFRWGRFALLWHRLINTYLDLPWPLDHVCSTFNVLSFGFSNFSISVITDQ